MNSAAQRTRSVWMADLPAAPPGLTQDLSSDVAVVGAGIAGITTAYLLARAGRSVILLNDGPAGGGMTGRTTGHLTCALDDLWANLITLMGEENARLAAESHAAAIAFIDHTQQEESIDCDFARLDGYLVLAAGDTPDTLEHEFTAARRLGLAIDWAPAAPLPGVKTGRCLRFARQGRFHALKYITGLLQSIERGSARLYDAHVVSVSDGKPCRVETASGHRVTAGAVVVATNVPINDRVTIHTKQAPYRTYVIAGHVPKGSIMDALCWDTGDPYHYTRLQPGTGEHDTIIIGGEDHKTGQAHDMEDRLRALEVWGRDRFPQLGVLTHRWSGQVMETIDYLGYLGRNPGDANVYIATGDSGMGLTHGTIAGMVISDLILGRTNPWAALYDPARKTFRATREYARENLNVAAQLTEYLTGGDVRSAADIVPGNGAVLRHGLHKIAAFRDADGTLHENSAVCPHMGCIVEWNPLENCWDCPCHGSQFSPTGDVLNGPATMPLSPREPEQQRRRG